MKTNNLTDATKVLILVATVIVVCVLCAIGFKMVNNGKSAVTANTNNLNDMAGQYQDIDLSLYEGSLVPGSEVSNIIKTAIDDKQYLAVTISSLDGSTNAYNYVYDSTKKTIEDQGSLGQTALKILPKKKSELGYINPMAMFLGETLKDSNNTIVCLRFTQQP
jgi:hypothetical protein